MNREIKFRAWDRENKELVYPFYNNNPYNDITVGDIIKRFEILMQYTGLKDKNGKEIYEGDIVTPDCADEINYVVKYIVDENRQMCGFYLYNPYLDYTEKTTQFGAFNVGIKVIGNKYENPELIEND